MSLLPILVACIAGLCPCLLLMAGQAKLLVVSFFSPNPSFHSVTSPVFPGLCGLPAGLCRLATYPLKGPLVQTRPGCLGRCFYIPLYLTAILLVVPQCEALPEANFCVLPLPLAMLGGALTQLCGYDLSPCSHSFCGCVPGVVTYW